MAIKINNTTVIDDSRNIQNVGVGTITTLNATGVVATAERTTWSQVGSGLTFTTGIATNFTVSGVGTITQLVSTNVNVSGVSSVGSGITLTSTGDIRFAGIITGRGSGIVGVTTTLVASVGVQSAGAIIGAGITQLNFIGAGNTFAVRGTTVDISIAGGGGGVSTTGIATALIFSNFGTIYQNQSLGQSGYNYFAAGPLAVTATVTVGAGSTFVII